MPWTPPSDPVTSTVITVAYAVANLLTQIRWLRLMTGNADPPATAYVVVSDSTSATSWKKVPGDALADDGVDNRVLATGAALANIGGSGVTNPYLGTDAVDDRVLSAGAALANLGFTPVNKLTDSNVGMLTFGSGQRVNFAQENGNKIFLTAAGDYSLGCADFILQISSNRFVGLRNNTAGPGDYSASFDTVNNVHTFHGQVRADTLVVANVQAGATPGAGRIPIADASGKLDAWITGGGGSGGSYIPHTHGGDALIPATVNGAAASATPGPGRIPIADASGLLDAWVSSAAAAVPSGLVALWAASDTAPTGWTFDTQFRDRFVVGAGASYARSATGGVTTHGHGGGSHNHSGSPMTIAGTAAATANTNGLATAGGVTLSTSSHTHAVSGSVAGNTADQTISTDNQGHLPPYIAAHYIRKV